MVIFILCCFILGSGNQYVVTSLTYLFQPYLCFYITLIYACVFFS